MKYRTKPGVKVEVRNSDRGVQGFVVDGAFVHASVFSKWFESADTPSELVKVEVRDLNLALLVCEKAGGVAGAPFDRLYRAVRGTPTYAAPAEFVMLPRNEVEKMAERFEVHGDLVFANFLRAAPGEKVDCTHENVEIVESESVGIHTDDHFGRCVAKKVQCSCGATRERGWVAPWKEPTNGD